MSSDISVLLVDDQERYLQKLQESIQFYAIKYGFAREQKFLPLSYASTIKEGLEKALQGNYDLIFLDVNFDPSDYTNEDGITKFLPQLREQEKIRGKRTPVICWSQDKDFR
jgi:CheY-like chemotaxis protein